MVSLSGELHLWTLKNNLFARDTDVGCFTYHDKGVPGDVPYNEEKQMYVESRDATWIPRNKRPEKLRDTLKEVEEMLGTYKCIKCKWLNKRLFQILLSNGTILTLLVSLHTGDLDRIIIDKSLVGKFSSDSAPTDVLFTDNYIVVAYTEKPKLDFLYFTKKVQNESQRRLEKVSYFDPKLSYTELPGPIGRRLNRHLSHNVHQDLVLAWWPTATEEAWPWSPMTGEQERANLVLMAVNGMNLDVITYCRTEYDPLGVQFSLHHPARIVTVEQSKGNRGEANANICSYEAARTKILHLTVTTVPLKAPVVCEGRNHGEEKVLLGCEDNTLVLYDEQRKVTQMTTAGLNPYIIHWHPSGTIVIVASRNGEFQMFDLALAPVLSHLTSESPIPQPTLPLKKLFRVPPAVSMIQWGPLMEHQEVIAECTDSLAIIFDRGPIGVFQCYMGVLNQGLMTPVHLVNQYVKFKQIDEAINVLCALNWNVDGASCIASLMTIFNHLLRMPLNPDREAQLEAALGSFYSPVRPISEEVVLQYRVAISRMARRFFHHLLRFTRFDKAFLLAVDLGARDLFMDIHYLAKDKGEVALSEVAYQKAQQIDAASFTSDSYEDSQDDDDEIDDSLEDSEDGDDDSVDIIPPNQMPPPLPPYQVAKKKPQRTVASSRRPLPIPPGEGELRDAPPLDPRFVHRPSTRVYQPANVRYMPEEALQQLEEELASDLFTEYTATMLDQIPPPKLSNDEDRENNQGEVEEPKSVQVVHFGVV